MANPEKGPGIEAGIGGVPGTACRQGGGAGRGRRAETVAISPSMIDPLARGPHIGYRNGNPPVAELAVMTIFAILLPAPEPAVENAIKNAYPNDHLSINETQWLVSTAATAIDVSAKIGVFDPRNPAATPTGNAVIFSTNGYFGRAPTNIWEWIKAKLEATPSG